MLLFGVCLCVCSVVPMRVRVGGNVGGVACGVRARVQKIMYNIPSPLHPRGARVCVALTRAT